MLWRSDFQGTSWGTSTWPGVFGSCVVSAGIHLGESGGHQKALAPLSCSFVLVALWWIGIRLWWVSLPLGDGGMLNDHVIPANARTKKIQPWLVLWSRIGGLISRLGLDVIDQRITSSYRQQSDHYLPCVTYRSKKSYLIIHKSLQENLKKNKWKRGGGGQRVDINNQVCQWITSSPQTF